MAVTFVAHRDRNQVGTAVVRMPSVVVKAPLRFEYSE